MLAELKVLNVVTCAAVLTAVGWWGWSEWNAAQSRFAPLAASADVEEVLRGAAPWQDACQAIVDAWDGGERPDLAGPLGPAAAAQVERCRRIVTMRPQVWATD
ncbi:hypothetical protein [Rubellimicrobium mesophilum]|uniref:hypothetical protein n=1 Tax=Rubellimicrobium mesophilum TaxID=1123067 RepID=UPI00055D50FD|nr:hypothetical protein [Rubellimicrobium mesophilum]